MMTDNATNDTMDRINAMQGQEETIHCFNYFERKACKDIDASSRKSMVEWCQQVQNSLNMSPETAWIAVSLFDRYLSSGKGKSHQALQDRYKFQLAAITSFYTAVKINETVKLDAVTLAELCRGFYAASDIVSMEEDILFALNWRVSCPTPMDFAREMIEFLPEKARNSISEYILEATQKYVDSAASDFFFTFCKPSVIGASCLASSLTGSDILSASDRQAFWLELARITDLIEVIDAQNKLLAHATLSKPITRLNVAAKKRSIPSKSAAFRDNKTTISSPVCVTHAARQA
mmetsp:Transcript_40928/g.85992  ORF Transcript_40928/g.85992 Transcript_40928/m.85992 type:complete len:291 (+) Transcript_40928:135-1007(+)